MGRFFPFMSRFAAFESFFRSFLRQFVAYRRWCSKSGLMVYGGRLVTRQ